MWRRAAIILVSVVLACSVMYWVSSRNRFAQSNAGPDSPDVRQAMETLRGIAADPESVPSCMSKDANERARAAVVGSANQMRDSGPIELASADWFGEYLRVAVRCSVPDGKPLDKYFFLKKEDGRLRVTGVESQQQPQQQPRPAARRRQR